MKGHSCGRIPTLLILVLLAGCTGMAARAQGASVLTAPANGATVSPQNIQFSWTAVPGVINYTLWIGTSAGADDALYYTTGNTSNPTGITSTSASLNPRVTYYATLWTLTSAGYITSTSTFQTSATSYLTAPVNGATVSPQSIQFSWTAVPGVINYTLWIGTSAGADDALYYTTGNTSNPTGITSTSAKLNPGVTYYVTLWTLTSAGYTTSTSTFQTSATSYLTAPVNGATVSPQNIQFSWTAVPGVINYTLWVGTSAGANDALYFNTGNTSNPTGTTSTSASLQPGTAYYVTLWTLTSAGYTTTTSTFQTLATSYLTAPLNGATVTPQNIQFSWAAVPGVINYTLWIGTTAGAKDALYYSTGNTSNPAGITSTSASLKPGATYYMRRFGLSRPGRLQYLNFDPQDRGDVVSDHACKRSHKHRPICFGHRQRRPPIQTATSYAKLMLGSSAGANNYYDSGAVTATSVQG